MAGFTFNITDLAEMMNARDLVTKKIVELVRTNPKVCYINSDGTGQTGIIRELYDEFPDRALDVGIAEMNLVTVAAGLARKGYIPFGQTFGPFLCVRALDQIHNDLAYNDLPVRLIGTHGGLTSGYGPTHNTIVEFGIMNSIPNMTMIAPCDGNQCVKMLEASLDYPGPIYIRIPRGEEPAVYTQDYEYIIGKAIQVKEGKNATIIATGSGVYNSLQAALKLEREGLHVGVIDMHTIKPIDKEAIIRAARETQILFTVEDHNILGGLGSIVADVVMEAGMLCRLKKIGIPDEFVSFGYPEEIYPHYGLDADGIAKTVRAFCV
ncbi:MAG: transketolase C-terminal domain-containing protein [Bacillota bacterium]|nr:transketolase C-terminal domain-containing protein [Bacillota bacterium]